MEVLNRIQIVHNITCPCIYYVCSKWPECSIDLNRQPAPGNPRHAQLTHINAARLPFSILREKEVHWSACVCLLDCCCEELFGVGKECDLRWDILPIARIVRVESAARRSVP
jgi:hypothetical protein